MGYTENQPGYTLEVQPDEWPLNPRKEYDNLATFCCDHGRYDLGDSDGHEKARTAVRNSRYWKASWDGIDLHHGPNIYAVMAECEDIVMLPLYLYDHSGITISTTPFSCPWDSGQVGFAFMTRDVILKYIPGGVQRLSQKQKAEARRLIRLEVKTYDAYLTGDCWQWSITDTDTNEIVESCGGYLAGFEDAKTDGRDALKALAAKRALRIECV